MDRAPGPTKNFVRGRSGYVPFWPGGLEDAVISVNVGSSKAGLKTIPPGFTRGLRLAGDADDSLLALDDLHGPAAAAEDELVSPDSSVATVS
jgi:antiviral helicase SKI2